MLIPLLALITLVTAQEVVDAPFPYRSICATEHRIDLAPIAADIERLSDLQRVRLTNIQLPAAEQVSATLVRVALPIAYDAFFLDGRPTWFDPTVGLSMWSGRVDGRAESDVFLSFSEHGCWGWIDVDGHRHHLISERGVSDQWDRCALVTDEWVERHRSGQPLYCGVEAMAPPALQPSGSGSGKKALAATPPVLAVRLALETDWQYFQIFGNEMATTAYTVALVGAASARYREQVDIVLTLEYLGVYTTPADPWLQPDLGGNCFQVLDEFKTKWSGGGAPVTADIYHFFTGTDTKCGVASGKLCDATGAWSVTGKMDGKTPFPIQVGPLNWDFTWFCHETGHNFGSPHTHAFCPPIDECAPTGYFGPCQTQQVCITNATFMSYCHACPGGLANYTTYFHPLVAGVMRAQAESGCLALFEGVLTEDLGEALPGSNGRPELSITYADGPDTVTFGVQGAPSSQRGAFITSTTAVYQPFLGGGTLVPSLALLLYVTADGPGNASTSLPVGIPFPAGITLFSQAWFLDPSGTNGYAASNAMKWELIRP